MPAKDNTGGYFNHIITQGVMSREVIQAAAAPAAIRTRPAARHNRMYIRIIPASASQNTSQRFFIFYSPPTQDFQIWNTIFSAQMDIFMHAAENLCAVLT